MSQKSVKFHILSEDYFGTLATICSLINQNLRLNKVNKNECRLLLNLEKDLLFLQKKYKIVKK